LARRGGSAVFFGRFVAFFRATMPALAGTAGMRYPKFLAFNAAGGVVWGVGVVLLGYLAGNSYSTIEKTFGRATALIAVAVIVIGLVGWRIRRRSGRRRDEAGPADHDADRDTDHDTDADTDTDADATDGRS
jgi:membrane protein DedA with SNARE-associated domain